MNDDERLTVHESASFLHSALMKYMADTGATAKQAEAHFNKVAEKLGIKVRVVLVASGDAAS
jgi:hypothetical protein